jgi:hypothetical protein
MIGGNATAARHLASDDPDPAFALLVVDAWLEDGVGLTALDRLIAACRAAPLHEEHLVWCARAASNAGDAERAFEMGQLLEVLGTGLSIRAGLLRVDDDTGAAAGNLPRFWGTFTYRRPTPADMLVPSLVHLRLD